MKNHWNHRYTIIRRPKRKTASIVIRADNRVEVLAPSRMPSELIDRFVQEKSGWIQKKLYFNREVKAAYVAKTFLSGETFLMLGMTYSLQLQYGNRAIALCESTLLVSHPEPESETTKRQIVRWYRQQAENHFMERCRFFSTIIGKQPQSVGVKSYKSRWGSCHHDGRIYFNWRLIMAPEWVIDYVVAHELCHLIHPNHSKQFHDLLQSIYPTHKAVKSWLHINGQTLAL
ncbi:MAG: SprT family zinc-dependent metalloprotease [Mariprofundus sp.]|nr:SprT family zinc-dependent metalloprotease [Mariprofundus sp.]